MTLPDYPIEQKEQDLLKRFPLATKVAEMLMGFEGKESFVIGVEGRWGAGKTSFINLVLGQIKPESVIHFTFNPWNFSDQSSLLRDFFIRYSEAVEKVTGKKIGRRLKEYAGKISEVDLGLSYWGLSVNPFKFFGLFKPDTSLDVIRKELNEALSDSKIDKKIVVVIDDIDRLDREETKLILKLVKLIADFPNTIFILAYDRERVEKRITEEANGFEGNEYLKKIIQVSFTLPEPDEVDLRQILFRDLDKTIEAAYGDIKLEGEDDKRWGELLYAGFPKLFKTVRDIKRYISSLRLNWSIVEAKDVNVVDFLAVEAIRVFAPHFYSAIAGNKSLFTESEQSLTYRLQEGENKSQRYTALLEKVPTEFRTIVDKITKELFPQLEASYGDDSQQRWRREKRICAAERFGFYFQLGIPTGGVSESEIAHLIATLGIEADFQKEIDSYMQDKRIRPILSKLLDYTDKFTESQVEVLIKTLWNITIPEEEARNSVFDFDDPTTQIMRLAYHSIKNGVPTANRSAFLEKLARESINLYRPSHFIGVLQQELDKKEQSDDTLITQSDIEKPKAILLERIKQLADEHKLHEDKNLAFYLFRWREWENEDSPKKYVTELVQTRTGLLAYMRGFVAQVLSTAGNYNRIDKEALTTFIPLDIIQPLVNAISPEELSMMNTKDQEAIELFKNPKKDW